MFSTYDTYFKLEKYANGSEEDVVPTELYYELINFTSFRIPKNPKGKAIITYTTWPKNTEGEYSLVLTEFGLCHCFHSKLAQFFNIEYFQFVYKVTSMLAKAGYMTAGNKRASNYCPCNICKTRILISR